MINLISVIYIIFIFPSTKDKRDIFIVGFILVVPLFYTLLALVVKLGSKGCVQAWSANQ